MGPTHPNRLMQMSGTLDPAGTAGGPVLFTNGSPSAVFSVHWDTMPEVLEDAGVSWKHYNPPGDIYTIPSMQKLGLTTDSVLPYFSQYSNPSSTLYQKAFLPTFPGDFAADVRAGTLPQVSWICTPIGYDEHPPAPPFLGEWFTDQVLRTLVSNPDVWSKTVLFHMYDENDGFFDHVDPPVAPAGTEGEFVSVQPLPAAASGIAGPIGLGFRVPLLVLHRSVAGVGSARRPSTTRPSSASSRTFRGEGPEHLRLASVRRWGICRPPCSWTRRTRRCRHFPPPPTTRPTLHPRAARRTISWRAAPQPIYPLPAVQKMPTQEAGAPKS